MFEDVIIIFKVFFIQKYIKIIFYFKKIFLTIIYQNDLKQIKILILKKINFLKKRILKTKVYYFSSQGTYKSDALNQKTHLISC
jgi:hypothetical protein